MLLKDLDKLVNEKIKLRNPNLTKVEEYAEKMEAGVVFPPLTIGYWPKSEKYGESGIVDGIHRLIAATKAKVSDLPTVSKKFETLEEALMYMYQANMAHGLPVSEGQRNTRIQLLRKIDPKLNIDKLAKQFGLGRSSIDRILKGEQGEGRSGPKGGATKNKAHQSTEPKKASAIYKIICGLNTEFVRKRPNQIIELGAYLTPISEEAPEGAPDKERMAELDACIAFLAEVLKLAN